ncbi:MmgE/PrpD family protein [Mesorhizobium sp. ZC-5]|uniref:MmgE/PrpD family protein n=1 Tax=Mesorhizobium sp. ZC-5 TaxID=2986066 RepID=UPI0021E7D3F5|nr:MmgE/PrpD family protein [Mesorhizobium sp. ZC-5]MCV3241161.1 MmgE/PrpD family protein [Mesorhizobium sp. ZC-5]
MRPVRQTSGPMTGQAFTFIQDFRFGDAPAEVVVHAKRSLLDLIGVAAAGSRLPVSDAVRTVSLEAFGGTDAGFFFDGRKASVAGAAFANAMTIDGFDAHDGHPLTKGHAGCGVLAALAAFAGDGASLSGEAALAHLIAGYEVAIRAGIALHATAPDYHTSGAWVALGAAAVGSRVMKLDRAATREALGIAEFYGPRSQMMRCIDHPTMVKDGSGWGAMTGVSAALLAQAGFTGAPAITVEGDDVARLWSDLGSRWRMSEQYLKAYPVCRWAQPAMEAAAQLQRDHDFTHSLIERITVRTFREASRLAVAAPEATDAAQYSLPFPVAALLVRGQVGPDEIDGDALGDAEILRVSRSVELVDDPRYSALFPAERWAEVEIGLSDGRVLRSRPSVARGSAENPLSDAEVEAKFDMLMEAGGVAERAESVKSMVMTLETAPSVAPLLEAITCPPLHVSKRMRAAE